MPTDALELLPTCTELENERRRPLGPEDVLSRRRKSGGLCWLAATSRPDICARLAFLAVEVSHLQGYDVSRIND